MPYEVYAPDETDEFFDELCDDAWARMWNGGYDFEDEFDHFEDELYWVEDLEG